MEMLIPSLIGILTAVFGVLMFVIGYNISAPAGKKIAIKKKKAEKTEDEKLLEAIDRARL